MLNPCLNILLFVLNATLGKESTEGVFPHMMQAMANGTAGLRCFLVLLVFISYQALASINLFIEIRIAYVKLVWVNAYDWVLNCEHIEMERRKHVNE